jgi:6-phosphogluconate dehydrogenase
MSNTEFGIIGMGVMGKSLALNLASKNIGLSIFNRHVAGLEEGVARKIAEENPHANILGFDDLQAFVQSLKRPRKILIMILAGPPVDGQIEALLPYLEEGDVLIDGGNSHYADTARRVKLLAEKKIYFVGCGISGGEEGALKGPSLMPGGSKEGYAIVAPFFDHLAARDKQGKPCNAYVGKEGAGHFVKMVHNGIEYAEMQILAETYALLRYYLGMEPSDMVQLLQTWKEGGLDSYLLEITIGILQVKEGDGLLLDKILDKAKQKGTGGWSVTAALEHGAPFGVITESVMARALSSLKSERVQAAQLYNREAATFKGNTEELTNALRNAYQAARIINHHVGFAMMRQVSDDYAWDVDFSEVARIWTNGCIIRSELMEEMAGIYKRGSNLLMAPEIVQEVKGYQKDFARIVGEGLQAGVAMPVFSTALNYYLGYTTANSPANLIQAQRDFFGAHTYQRTDSADDQYFHTNWIQL